MSISDWSDMMPETVTHAELASRDAYGARNYGTPASYSVRVSYKPTLIRTTDGSEVVAKGFIWFQGTPNIDPEDQVTLPDGSTPPILAVERVSDQSGLHHTKLFFG